MRTKFALIWSVAGPGGPACPHGFGPSPRQTAYRRCALRARRTALAYAEL